MGCVTSSPQEHAAPPEPLPDIEKLQNTRAPIIQGEPVLCDGMTDTTSSACLQMKQTGALRNGNTFEIAPPGTSEQDKNDLLVEPAFSIGGQQLRRQMQDLEVLHYNKRIDSTQTPKCFITKDVARGTNYFQILVDSPVRSTQGERGG